MEAALAELREAWQQKKAKYEALLDAWFPKPRAGEPLPPLEPVPPAVMAELERLEHEAEQARLAYLGVLLSRPRE